MADRPVTTAVGRNAITPLPVTPDAARPTSLTAKTSTEIGPSVSVVKVQLGDGPAGTLVQVLAVGFAAVVVTV